MVLAEDHFYLDQPECLANPGYTAAARTPILIGLSETDPLEMIL